MRRYSHDSGLEHGLPTSRSAFSSSAMTLSGHPLSAANNGGARPWAPALSGEQRWSTSFVEFCRSTFRIDTDAQTMGVQYFSSSRRRLSQCAAASRQNRHSSSSAMKLSGTLSCLDPLLEKPLKPLQRKPRLCKCFDPLLVKPLIKRFRVMRK